MISDLKPIRTEKNISECKQASEGGGHGRTILPGSQLPLITKEGGGNLD